MDASSVTFQKDPVKHVVRALPLNKLRWIDFDNGDDDNDGLTKATPWKTLHGNVNGNTGFWYGAEENVDQYFHGGQIGPGYEYRLRGTLPNTDHATWIQSLASGADPEFGQTLLGTEEHPIVFTSWDIVNDRALIAGDYPIETTSNYTDYASGHATNDNHWTKWIGIDFILHGENTVMYGHHYSFIDCTFTPTPESPEYGVGMLIYGDWCLFDRCYFRGTNEWLILLYGVYTTIQNCVFQGLNWRGGELDRTSDNDYDKRGMDVILLIYMQGSAPPYGQSDALRIINNTFIGWGSPDSGMYGIFQIYDDYGVGYQGLHTGIIIRNNIFVDIVTSIPIDEDEEESLALWYIEPTLAPIVIDHNLFGDDLTNFPEEQLYRNGYETFDDSDEVITFDPDTDKVFVDPKFVDKYRGNFRLKGSSLAINAGGTNLSPGHDFLGHRRGRQPDIGAYEHHKN